MGRPVHFEIHADDTARAAGFYTAVFGWNIHKWDGPMDYWLIKTGEKNEPGIDGGLLKRIGPPPAQGAAVNAFPCTVSVESVDASLEKIVAAGGTVAMPKMPVPGVGWLAYAKDTEGNIFGILQSDMSAR